MSKSPESGTPDPSVSDTGDTADTGGASADSSKSDAPRSRIVEGVRDTASRLWRKHMKGEHVEVNEQESTAKRMTKLTASGLLSGAASLFGVKIIADLPRYLSQRFVYKPRERKRMLDAFKSYEAPEGEGHVEQIAARAAKLRTSIEESTHLSPDEKATMIARVEATLAAHNEETAAADEERNQAISGVIDRFVASRVTGVTVVKEAANTALLATGLATLRGTAYGAVALGERARRVYVERKEGERNHNESFMKQWILDGVKETISKLKMEGEGGKFEKGLRFIEAASAVTRLLGFTGLAVGEFTTGEFSEKIDGLVTAFHEKSLVDFAKGNLEESVYGKVFSMFGGATEALDAEESAVAAETTAALEVQEALAPQVEIGTIRSGDGLVAVLARQFKAQAEEFGFSGSASEKAAWASKQAMDLARHEGFIHEGGDVRLSTESIGNLAVAIEHGTHGPEAVFLDAHTGSALTPEAADAANFFYDFESSATAGARTASEAVDTSATRVVEAAHTGADVEAGDVALGERDIGYVADLPPDAGVVEVEPVSVDTIDIRRLGSVNFTHQGGEIVGWSFTGEGGLDAVQAQEILRVSENSLSESQQDALHKFYVIGRAVRQLERSGRGDSEEVKYLKTAGITLYRQLNRLDREEILKPNNAIVKSAKEWINAL